ncbi:hypothetical protein BKA83DRAFT_4480973 [Pisolithus microcarpus]|nr:hypothetical protein BKA83DRAFT_4480973 [Pisolithus microcarpus]
MASGPARDGMGFWELEGESCTCLARPPGPQARAQKSKRAWRASLKPSHSRWGDKPLDTLGCDSEGAGSRHLEAEMSYLCMSRHEGEVLRESRGEGDTSLWAQDAERRYLRGARGAKNASKGAWHVKSVLMRSSKSAQHVKDVSEVARDAKGASTRSSKEARGVRAVCMRSREVVNTSMKARSEGNTSKGCSRVHEDEGERSRVSRGLEACSKMTESEENKPPYCPNDPLSTNVTVDHLSRHENETKSTPQGHPESICLRGNANVEVTSHLAWSFEVRDSLSKPAEGSYHTSQDDELLERDST